jgi:hypothetical protein
MIKLVRPPMAPPDFRYPEDVHRIVKSLESLGYTITPEDAEWAWEEYSDDRCAGWLFVPYLPIDIYDCIKEYLVELPEQEGV